ncbi:sigma-54-dependent transcriptional regulator [Methylobacterium oxalidis]|uniref:sigma-54-dependent transcriptional regulator n=1 Tax=Methylobacterium oxalidis TaxID=944322 RepID=UPI0011BFACAE|nr:sigma-54 dependent transcriptional regulator [Methylobacterium oxalidis]GJE34048.1 Regulatory protein AtoC [Methylobacterium oxalidis]
MGQSILLIEDEVDLAENVARYLTRRGFDVAAARSGVTGLAIFDRQPDIDLVLLDINLPDLHGLRVLEEIRRRDRQVKIICITGHGSVQVAVDAMKAGAYDYVAKPLVLSELKILIDKALGQERLEKALSYYAAGGLQDQGISQLLGDSVTMQRLRDRISAILDAERSLREGVPPAVLIRGETGTGKELVARAFHFGGSRESGPFLEINCSALPPHLLESELFGHERGAFTDARERKLGLVEMAHGGTLFLDEIGDTEPSVQVKLLKLLEDRMVRRVGGLRDRSVDVRFLSATNRPLEELVKAGRFRADLYYRLRVITVDIEPLRKRDGDAELLAGYFLRSIGARYQRPHLRLTDRALGRIRAHAWPGNVRELRNVIEQAVLSTRDDVIDEVHLAVPPGETPTLCNEVSDENAALVQPVVGSLGDLEKNSISRALDQTHGNVTRAAKLLGISRDTLRYRMEKYRIG